VTNTCMRREALRIRRPRQQDQLSQSNAAASLSTAPIPDIEALHTAACEAGAMSFIDPTTGLTCFTRLAHLKRGVCCGSQCRHCPYGWANVRVQPMSQTNEDSGDSSSSDDDSSDNSSSHIDHSDRFDVQQLTMSLPTTSSEEDIKGSDQQHFNAVTGGAHGGVGTKKNVPYTRTGDRGTAQLLTGERRRKCDATFEALGTVDELCSHVGLCHATLMQVTDRDWERLPERLLEIMSRLFDIGSHVANPRHTENFTADGVGNGFDAAHVIELEGWIDEMTEALPELSSFVLPTGTPGAAQLHVARTVCRRAERTMVPLVAGETRAEEPSSSTGECDPNALAYVNRLSDFFFTAARWVNDRGGASEIAYRRPTRNATQRTRVTLRSSDEARSSSNAPRT
jgi:cob(I)alamin adenosyltransferase